MNTQMSIWAISLRDRLEKMKKDDDNEEFWDSRDLVELLLDTGKFIGVCLLEQDMKSSEQVNREDLAAALNEGAGADIWFDAKHPGDEGAEETIEETQEAMNKAAVFLLNARTMPEMLNKASEFYRRSRHKEACAKICATLIFMAYQEDIPVRDGLLERLEIEIQTRKPEDGKD